MKIAFNDPDPLILAFALKAAQEGMIEARGGDDTHEARRATDIYCEAARLFHDPDVEKTLSSIELTAPKLLAVTIPKLWGYIPSYLDVHDERPAAAQLAARYIGGWKPRDWFHLEQMPSGYYALKGKDVPVAEIARMWFGSETLVLFEQFWCAIIQPDGSYEVACVD